MLWGSALAAGAEAHRRHADRGEAIGAALATTRRLVASFTERTGSANCRDVTAADFEARLGTLRYVLGGGAWRCFQLAAAWAPEAIRIAAEGPSQAPAAPPPPAASCASEVALRKGAPAQQVVMVAGLAGGLGLGGQACGALGAAVWLDSLAWSEAHPERKKELHDNPRAARTVAAFEAVTGGEFQCPRIAGRRFATVEEHTAFVQSGGCGALIEALGRT